jgi:hypothetical protein
LLQDKNERQLGHGLATQWPDDTAPENTTLRIRPQVENVPGVVAEKNFSAFILKECLATSQKKVRLVRSARKLLGRAENGITGPENLAWCV